MGEVLIPAVRDSGFNDLHDFGHVDSEEIFDLGSVFQSLVNVELEDFQFVGACFKEDSGIDSAFAHCITSVARFVFAHKGAFFAIYTPPIVLCPRYRNVFG